MSEPTNEQIMEWANKHGLIASAHSPLMFRDAFEDAQAMLWQPIATAPRDTMDERLVVYSDLVTIASFDQDDGHNGNWLNRRGDRIHPTHWMPLPKGPTA